MKASLNTASYFLKTGIWLAPEGNHSRIKKFFLNLLKVSLLSIRGYDKNSLEMRVSSLTFYTFLSMVPTIAVAFGIAKGFGLDRLLKVSLTSALYQQEHIMETVFEYADVMLQKTSGGIVAGIGIPLLLWTIFKLLSSIEETFNTIWKVPESRSIGRKTADYLSLALVGPIFFIVSTSLTVTLMAHIKTITHTASELGIPPSLVTVPLRLIPFIMVWSLFSFILIWMPNTRVRWDAGIIAGIIAGTSYQLLQWAYIAFQIDVSKNNAIYGSLAAIPLLLAWMQISWRIVLLGSEISHAIQELDTLGYPTESDDINPRHRKILAILIVSEIVKGFKDETERLTSREIAAKLKISSCLANSILFELSDAGLVAAVKPNRKDKRETWQPGKDIHQITVASILEAIDQNGTIELDCLMSNEFRSALGILDTFSQTLDASPANRLIINM